MDVVVVAISPSRARLRAVVAVGLSRWSGVDVIVVAISPPRPRAARLRARHRRRPIDAAQSPLVAGVVGRAERLDRAEPGAGNARLENLYGDDPVTTGLLVV